MSFEDDKQTPKTKLKDGFGSEFLSGVSPDEIALTNGDNVPSRQESDSLTITEQASTHYVFDTTEELSAETGKKRKRKKQKSNITLYSIIVAIIWIIAAILIINQSNPSINNPSELFTLIVTLLGPAAFAILAGVMADALNKSNNNARILARSAQKLLQPEETMAEGARSTIVAIRDEISKLEDTLTNVTGRLGSLEEAIESKTTVLRQASEDARKGTYTLVDTMENERARLGSLLDGIAELTKTAQITTRNATLGLDEKAQLLVEATRALAHNSSEATQSAQIAAQKLDSAVSKATLAIGDLDEASQRGEQALSRAHDLMILARVRADDAVDGVNNVISSLHNAAENATNTVTKVSNIINQETYNAREFTANTIDEVRVIAEESARKIANALKQEAQSAKTIAEQSLAALENTTSSIRQLALEASTAISEQLENNSVQVENLKQHSFEMNKEADKFVENRLVNARNLISQSADILNHTGSQIEARFTTVAKACADQARSVEDVIDALNLKLSRLPLEAKERAEAVENALSDTLLRLNETGRKAAEETHALDVAFQDRLKQSYSALGEVVQRLGGLSGVIGSADEIPPPNRAIDDIKPKPNSELKSDSESNPEPEVKIELGHETELDYSEVIPNPISFGRPKNTDFSDFDNASINDFDADKIPTENETDQSDTISPRPKFSSILSPQTPIRSVKQEDALHDVSENSIGLRGRDYIDEVEKQLNQPEIIHTPHSEPQIIAEHVEQTIKAEPEITEPEISHNDEISKTINKDMIDFGIDNIEEKLEITNPSENNFHSNYNSDNIGAKDPNKSIMRDNPFEGVNLGHDKVFDTRRSDWNWQDIFSAIDEKPTSNNNVIDHILNEIGIKNNISHIVLERLGQAYARGREKSLFQINAAMGVFVNGLEQFIKKSPEIRSHIIRYVEERRENAIKGRLIGDELALYLVAEVVLNRQ